MEEEVDDDDYEDEGFSAGANGVKSIKILNATAVNVVKYLK